ncbi:unnamed protein product [Protopolystoma xenopodis]|uniref:Uncharacterized protein n=1 Tax=Protopolystoma xenopodis TaxID=117903 RepID=A0A3S5BW53_9PLAT|nr:unnamed protein product [Protopolystoma xenopodis]
MFQIDDEANFYYSPDAGDLTSWTQRKHSANYWYGQSSSTSTSHFSSSTTNTTASTTTKNSKSTSPTRKETTDKEQLASNSTIDVTSSACSGLAKQQSSSQILRPTWWQPLWRRCDDKFFWNRQLLSEAIESAECQLQRLGLPPVGLRKLQLRQRRVPDSSDSLGADVDVDDSLDEKKLATALQDLERILTQVGTYLFLGLFLIQSGEHLKNV